MVCFDTSRGSPTLVITVASCCQCIGAWINNLEWGVSGEMPSHGLPCWLIAVFQKLTTEGAWAFPPGTLTPVPGLPDWLYSLGQVAVAVRSLLARRCGLVGWGKLGRYLSEEQLRGSHLLSLQSLYGYQAVDLPRWQCRCEHNSTETALVVLLLVWCFVGGQILSRKRLR